MRQNHPKASGGKYISAKEIVEHLAFNVLRNNGPLSLLDGWADQPNSNMQVAGPTFDDFEVQEVVTDA